MMTQDIIDYYTNLLIVQYETQPKARATIQAYVASVVADQIIAKARDAFNFPQLGGQGDTAKGLQLETLASYRGLKRNVYGLSVTRKYFRTPFYGEAGADTQPGFQNYGEMNSGWDFLSYANAEAPLYALADSDLARLLQLRAFSQTLLSVGQVDAILYALFGSKVGVFENSPMDITYADLTDDTDTLFDVAIATNSLPRPAGVVLHTERLDMLAGEFGFQIYGVSLDPDFIGYALYGTPLAGSFMRYF